MGPITRGVVLFRELCQSQPAAKTTETITPTKTAKSHNQSRDHARVRHDPDQDRTLVRVQLLGHVRAHHPDQRDRNQSLGREHRRDHGLDHAHLRLHTPHRTTTKKAAREKVKKIAIDREPL